MTDDIGQRSVEDGKGVQFRYGCARLGGSYPFTYSVTDDHGNILTERIEIDFFTKKFTSVNESFSDLSISDDNKTIWVNVHTDFKWFFQAIDIETMEIKHRIPLPEPPSNYAFNPYNKMYYISSYYYTADWEHKPGMFVIDPSKGKLVKKITLEHLPEYYDSWPRLAPVAPIFTASGLGIFELGHRIGYDNNKMLIDSRNNDALSYFNPSYSIHIPTSGLPIYYERQLTDNKRSVVGYDQYSHKLAVFDGEYGNFVDFIDVPVPFPHNPYLWTNKKNDRLFVKGYWEETIIDVKTKQRLGTSYNGFTPLGFSYRENEDDHVFGLADDYFFLLDYSNSETVFYFPINKQGGWLSGGATTTDGKYVVIANEQGIIVFSEKMFPKKKNTQQRMRMQSYGSKGVMKRVF